MYDGGVTEKSDYEVTKFIWGYKLLRYRLYLCNVKMSGFLEKKMLKMSGLKNVKMSGFL
jgi:hypothetical protein